MLQLSKFAFLFVGASMFSKYFDELWWLFKFVTFFFLSRVLFVAGMEQESLE